MRFLHRELMLIEWALVLLEKEIESGEPGCTFLDQATGLVPELKNRIVSEMHKKKYKNEPYWMGQLPTTKVVGLHLTS